MIEGHQKIPWEMAEKIEEVKEIASQIIVLFNHIFIETNQLADFIKNTTINQEDMKQFYSFNQQPSLGRKILNMYKNQIPTIRVRIKSINNNHKIQT
ncbi:hypothetical protein R3W88_031917 [Solanum pinnatisectum]|uniref:RNase H type-1 domain-containing protein n=1 Tax=Solanum pinnatisectum TaxID=50273 RepID=A0AAV9LMN8_9SOLN|nr:hypothetical protein R3W88_031917 [Solanum pinnatisectum]